MDEIFGNSSDLAWYQECARAALVFVYGLVLIRIAGRRIFGKWSALDIVVSMIIGSNLSRVVTGNAQLWGTLAATTLLVGLHWVLARLVSVSPGFSRLIEGRSIELARHGAQAVDPGALRGQRSGPRRGAASGGGGRHRRREDCHARTERQDYGAETRVTAFARARPKMTDAESLYERDFAAWTKQQAKALRAAACRSTNQAVDWEHLAEELPDSIALASADLDDYRELDAAAQARIRQSGYSIEQILENWFPPEPPQYASGR